MGTAGSYFKEKEGVGVEDALEIASNGNNIAAVRSFCLKIFLKTFQLTMRTVCLSDIFMLKEPTAKLLANISQIVQSAHTELQHRGRDEAQEGMWSTPHRLHSIAQSLHNKALKYSQKNGRRKLHIVQTAI